MARFSSDSGLAWLMTTTIGKRPRGFMCAISVCPVGSRYTISTGIEPNRLDTSKAMPVFILVPGANQVRYPPWRRVAALSISERTNASTFISHAPTISISWSRRSIQLSRATLSESCPLLLWKPMRSSL